MLFVNTHRLLIILNQTKRFQQKIYEHHLTGTNNHHQPSLLPPTLLQHQLIIKKQTNYHNKKNSIHVGAYVYSRLGELYKVHPNQKHCVGAKKFGIVMESKGANQWLVNFDG
jgi:hypothetical protein